MTATLQATAIPWIFPYGVEIAGVWKNPVQLFWFFAVGSRVAPIREPRRHSALLCQDANNIEEFAGLSLGPIIAVAHRHHMHSGCVV